MLRTCDQVVTVRAVLATFLIAVFAGCSALPPRKPTGEHRFNAPDPMTPKSEFRGMFVATAYNLDWPQQRYMHPKRLDDEIRAIVARAKKLNMNVIMLEERAFGDRMYRTTAYASEVWAKSLWDGNDPDAFKPKPDRDYDPLKTWITECHTQGIELYAWINPFRVRGKSPKLPSEAYQAANKEWYLDPSDPAAQDYVLGVIEELLGQKYTFSVKQDKSVLQAQETDEGTPKKMMILQATTQTTDDDTVDGIVVDHNYPPPGRAPSPSAQMLAPATAPTMKLATTERATTESATTEPAPPPYQRQFPRTASSVDDFWHELYGLTQSHGAKLAISPLPNDGNAQRWMQNGWVDFVIPEVYGNINDENGTEQFETPLQKNWLDQNKLTDLDKRPMIVAGINTAFVQTPPQPRPGPHVPERKPPEPRTLEEVHNQILKARALAPTDINDPVTKDNVISGIAMYSVTAMRSPEAGGPAADKNIGEDLIAKPNQNHAGLYADQRRVPDSIKNKPIDEKADVVYFPRTDSVTWNLPTGLKGVKGWEIWEYKNGQWGDMGRVHRSKLGQSVAGLDGIAVKAIHKNGKDSKLFGRWERP